MTTSGRATYTIPVPTDEVAAECHRVRATKMVPSHAIIKQIPPPLATSSVPAHTDETSLACASDYALESN